MIKKIIKYKWTILSVLLIISTGTIITLYYKYKPTKYYSKINIIIQPNKKSNLINKDEIVQLLKSMQINKEANINDEIFINIEKKLAINPYILSSKIFQNNLQEITVIIEENTPIARVFTTSGNSFYLGKNKNRMPIKLNYPLDIPIFTGFSSDNIFLSNLDSLLLQEIFSFTTLLENDKFWKAQINEINILPNKQFVIYSNLGNQVIELGETNNLVYKLSLLKKFMIESIAQKGIGYYQHINLQYSNQVIASTKNIISDSSNLIHNNLLKQSNTISLVSNHTDSVHKSTIENKKIIKKNTKKQIKKKKIAITNKEKKKSNIPKAILKPI